MYSVGVGGVTVVAGAGIAVCGGVFGMGLASRERGLSSVKSVRIGAGTGGGGSSCVAWARFDDRLLRLLENRLRPLLLAPDFVDARSGSSFAGFLSELKASLMRLPGDTLRRFPLGSAGTSSVTLDRVPGRWRPSLELSDSFVLGPLTVEPISAWFTAGSGESTDVALMRGEEDV